MTPNIAIVRIDAPHFRWPGIPLPLFLLWIPLVLLSPIILLVVLGVCIAGRIPFWRFVATVWGIVWNLSGTDVRVVADGNHVTVRLL